MAFERVQEIFGFCVQRPNRRVEAARKDETLAEKDAGDAACMSIYCLRAKRSACSLLIMLSPLSPPSCLCACVLLHSLVMMESETMK